MTHPPYLLKSIGICIGWHVFTWYRIDTKICSIAQNYQLGWLWSWNGLIVGN